MTKAIETEWIDISLGATGQHNVGAIVLNALHGITNGVTARGTSHGCCEIRTLQVVLQGNSNSAGGRVGEDEGYKVGTDSEFAEAGLLHGPYRIGNESNGGHAAAEAYAGAISSLLVDCVECTLGLVISLLLLFGVNHSDKLACRMAWHVYSPA